MHEETPASGRRRPERADAPGPPGHTRAPEGPEGPGLGVRIEQPLPLAQRVLDYLVRDLRIHHPEAVLPDPERPMVVVASHSHQIAPLPALAAVTRIYREHGLAHLVAGFYPHPLLLTVPGLKKVYEAIGVPTLAYDVDRLVDLMQEGNIHLAGTAPEGLNCNFLWKEPVAPIRTAGILEAAVLAGASVCLLAHLGAERWALQIRLPFSVPLTGGLQGVNIPLPPLLPLPRFSILFERYEPELTEGRLLAATRRERKVLLGVEMERIRGRLRIMTDALARRHAGPG